MHDSTQDSYRTIHAIHTIDSTFNFILNCTVNCTVLQYCKFVSTPYYYFVLLYRTYNITCYSLQGYLMYFLLHYTCIPDYVLLYCDIVLLNIAYITLLFVTGSYCIVYCILQCNYFLFYC